MKKNASKLTSEKLGALTMQLAAEITLKDLQSILGKEGIRVITLKGPHVGSVFYDDPIERIYCDLDLLVQKDSFAWASELLERSGFKPRDPNEGRAATEREFYNRTLFSPLGVSVDMHRDLSGYGRYPVDLDGMFSRAVRFRVGKVDTLGLSTEDLLLHLCIHILKTYFIMEKKHLCDIALLIEKRPIDWPLFCELAKRAGCASGTYYVLRAVVARHDIQVPGGALSRLRPGWIRRAWLERNLNVSAVPVYKYHRRSIFEAQVRMGLPLIDRPIDWAPLLVRYAHVRLEDAVRSLWHGRWERQRSSSLRHQ